MPTDSYPEVTAPAAVAVLLATHNGHRWLPEQVDSILNQEGVGVRIIAMDDASTDGTAEWLVERALAEPRLSILPSPGAAGSSSANFYRLLLTAQIGANELVAFSDQDDIWMPGKLARHARLISTDALDGVSSNVTSFTPGGRRSLVRKNYPQRPFDYLLESPGPGMTFLITPRLLRLTAELLSTGGPATSVEFHDSLIYAIARAKGWSWHIDDVSSVDYRQHDTNVMGSNVGAQSALARLRMIREHWLRDHATHLTETAIEVASAELRPQLERILALLRGRGSRNRLALARMASQLRRRPRDQRIIALLIAIGVW